MKHKLIAALVLTFLYMNVEGQIWNPAGYGLNNKVSRLLSFNNELYAIGAFTFSGDTLVNHISKWNGNSWSTVGSGLDSSVQAISVYNNELYVGGAFLSTNGVSVNHIAKWDGNNWISLGGGLNGTVFCITEYDGNLYAGGSFTLSDDVELNNIAKWDGISWSPVSIGFDSTVNILVVINNQLYAGGSFITADGNKVNHIAKWDGAEWSAIGNGMNGSVYDIKQFNNDIYAGGDFTIAEDTSVNYIAKWDGVNWLPVNTGTNATVYNLEIYNNNLYAIGAFTVCGGVNANKIAKWDGDQWENEGLGFNGGLPYCLKTFDEELFVGGDFTIANNISCSSIARLGPCPNLGEDKNKTIICEDDVTDISALYNTVGLSTEWDIANPVMAPFGIHKLIVTNVYGCKDSSLITVAPKVKTWLGKNSDNWNDTLNWSNNTLPDDSAHVIINSNTPYQCNITSDVSAASVEITKGANLGIASNHVLYLKANCDSLVSFKMELLPDAILIDSSSSSLIQLVDSTKVVFDGTDSLLQNLAVGKAIISGIAPNAPFGFLRKIDAIQIDGTTFTCLTSDASLTDVFKELHIDYYKTFSSADTFLQRPTSGLSFNVPINDFILYDADGNESTAYDQIKVDGSFQVTPQFHFAIDINPLPVRLDYARIEAGFESVFTQSITAGGSIANASREVNIFSQPLAVITIGPIVIVPNLRVSLGAEASLDVSATASVTNTFNATSYIQYQNHNWDRGYTKSTDEQFNFSGLNGNASAKIYAEPAIDFKLYNSNAIKGSIYAQAYLKADGQLFPSRSCSLKAGINAGAEAKIRALGVDLASVSYPDIFDFSKLLYTCSFANKPTVITTAISSIGNTTASGGGNVTNDNGATVTNRGICWSSTAQYPSLSNNVISSGVSTGAFSSSLSGLQPNTTYRVRAFATNNEGTSYGNTVSFTTRQPTSLPTLSTKAVTSITQTSAQSGGIITSPGNTSITSRGVCWSTSPNPTTLNNAINQGSGTGSYSINLTGLSANTNYYVRAFATNSFGTAYGNQQNFITAGGGGSNTVTDIDGNIYHTITIGTQVWMLENLKVSHYKDGSPIPTGLNDNEWQTTLEGAYSIYDDNENNNETYGKLYNWYAVNDSRGLTPNGWHIPSVTEWNALVNYLGGDSLAGGKLKEIGLAHWINPNIGATNNYGFTALPGGYRGSAVALYNQIGLSGNWWSSTSAGSGLISSPRIWNNSQYFLMLTANYRSGLSVRCIKD